MGVSFLIVKLCTEMNANHLSSPSHRCQRSCYSRIVDRQHYNTMQYIVMLLSLKMLHNSPGDMRCSPASNWHFVYLAVFNIFIRITSRVCNYYSNEMEAYINRNRDILEQFSRKGRHFVLSWYVWITLCVSKSVFQADLSIPHWKSNFLYSSM